MIKATELRVGNLVNKGSKTFVADFITIQMAHNYDPILLTPGMLEKCGFENRNNIFYHKSGRYFIVPMAAGTYSTFITDFESQKDIGEMITGNKYLHQLQNLYFALTGEELKIKL